MDSIGVQLRNARLRLGLTLREVEERTNVIAQERGRPSYRVSASWLDRVERENRGLASTKLIVLAILYNVSIDQLLELCPSDADGKPQLLSVSGPNYTLLLEQGPLERHARLVFPDKLVTENPPDDTTLLNSEPGPLPANYRRGIIGKRDRTMEPMLLGGAIVLIDTQRRTIAGRKEWTNEFDRPIYFLFTRAGYVCGFCELDKNSEWLTLVPHMLSPEPRDKRWSYRKEVEVVGTVAAVFTRRLSSARDDYGR